jgi:hypothetical protein
MDPPANNPSGTWNSDVVLTFLENLCNRHKLLLFVSHKAHCVPEEAPKIILHLNYGTINCNKSAKVPYVSDQLWRLTRL